MFTVKCFIVAVLIAVTEAEEKHVHGTISDDLEQKPADLLTSLAAEITKSDIEITVSGLRVPEEATTDATETNEGVRNAKTPENVSELKSDQQAASLTSAEDAQKITHTSDDNASFIHVKEKIARQSTDEEFAEANEQPKDRKTDDFMEHSETKHASDEHKIAEESHIDPEKKSKSRTVDKNEVEDSEKFDSTAAEDFEALLKSDDAEDDLDSTTQSRRMLSFDYKLLDALSIPNVETEPLLVTKSEKNNYEHIPPEVHDNHRAYHAHHSDPESRHGKPPGANPLAFPTLNAASLPPLTLFHSPGQPLHPHFPPHDNVDNPLSVDKGVPAFLSHVHEHPHFDETQNHHVNQHFKSMQQLFPQHYEQMQPLKSLRPFHFTQTFQHEPSLQPSPSFQMFQPLQPSHTFHTLESWQPLQSFQSIQSSRSSTPFKSSSSVSSKTVSPFQPPQMKMDNILSRLQDASQHPTHTEVSNQFSDMFNKNWNVVRMNTFTGR